MSIESTQTILRRALDLHQAGRLGEAERDRWLIHMAGAVERVCEGRADGAEVAAELLNYFVPAAEHLRNDAPLGVVE